MNDNDQEVERLMNEQLDGIATPEEADRLSRALEARPEFRAEYRKLGGVFAALSRTGMEDPPASLKQDVLRAIRAGQLRVPARESWLDSVAAVVRGRFAFRHAFSFASGAALGALAFALASGSISRPGSDPRLLSGTMAPLPAAGSYQHISSRGFILRDGHVAAEVLSGKAGLMVRIAADAPAGSEVILSFDPADWAPQGIRQQSAGNEVMLGMARLSVRMQRAGQSQYLLYLTRKGPAGSPLRISVHSPDGFVQGELEAGALRSGS